MGTGPIEKYQLKWHSHMDNLNNSVANLYRNERFADVMLITGDSPGIPAHRLVLSSCSHFFSSLFDNNSPPPNSLVYVVLPPELTRKSVEILVQYMYIGEATVPNDVLNEVLRGGEILKIRGLWRNTSLAGDFSDQHFSESASSFPVIPQNRLDSSSVSQTEREKLINRGHDILKESPVVVLNSKPTKDVESGRKTPKHEPRPPSRPSNYPRSNVFIKKDMAIDPCNPCESCIVSTRNYIPPNAEEASIRAPLSENQNHVNRIPIPSKFTGKFIVNTGQTMAHDGENCERQIIKANKAISDPIPGASYSNLDRNSQLERRNFNMVSIKQEPADWQEFSRSQSHQGVSIKPEVVYNDESSQSAPNSDEQGNNQNYSPLTCEICKLQFTVPKDWVRHIENHAEMPQTVPKKRRRTEEAPSDNIAALRCDLCCMYFPTTEWVRHIQNSHTESELALSNSNPESRFSASDAREENERCCAVCNQTFPSYASLIVHHRSHSAPAERAFCCFICDKEFNAKTSLRRHLKTMHKEQQDESDDENHE